MVMDFINGLILACTKEIGKKIRYQDMGSIHGMMEELIKDIG
jgi:hypothetical protein